MSALTWMADSSHISWRSFDTFTWVIFAAMALFVAWTIWRAVHLTVHPGEREGSHIKRQILQDPAALAVAVSSGSTSSTTGSSQRMSGQAGSRAATKGATTNESGATEA